MESSPNQTTFLTQTLVGKAICAHATQQNAEVDDDHSYYHFRKVVPLIEGLCRSNPCEFEFSICRRNRNDDLGIHSPLFWPTGPRTNWATYLHAEVESIINKDRRVAPKRTLFGARLALDTHNMG